MLDVLLAAPLGQALEPERQATAVVRIQKPALVTERLWERAPQGTKREIRLHEDGREIVIRVIEYE